jgi:hypothetical protein
MIEMPPPARVNLRKLELVILLIIFVLGTFLRIPPQTFAPGSSLHWLARMHPQPAFTGIGFDEGLYREYVKALSKHGITAYPDIVESYIATQSQLEKAVLPPVRFLYIFAGYAWHSAFRSEPLESLRDVAACFSVLTLGLATVFAWRLRGAAWGVGVAALMAFAPTQIHMSQHALIDGFFAFWALLCLWLLWENLQAPRDWRWLLSYSAALSLLIITKENSFFVCIALVVLIVANRWLIFGTVTRELLLATVIGPLLGVVILTFLAGGISSLFETYRLLVTKASHMEYAILTGDGPWYRYLVDLFLVSPIILVLAFGCVFQLERAKKPELWMSIFIAASYLVMSNVRYGMNLRYANIWDMALRFLAFSSLATLLAPLSRYRNTILIAAVAIICALELRQYWILAVQYPLYELITRDLMRAVHILKSP